MNDKNKEIDYSVQGEKDSYALQSEEEIVFDEEKIRLLESEIQNYIEKHHRNPRQGQLRKAIYRCLSPCK